MAGSIKWFEYTTNDNATFAIRMDESNGEAVGNADYSATSTAVFALPRNIKPRMARYVSPDTLYTRLIPVTSPTASAGTLPATITAEISGSATPITLALASFTGEQFTAIPRAADTGLLDGDAT
jgi:hypothetical protein